MNSLRSLMKLFFIKIIINILIYSKQSKSIFILLIFSKLSIKWNYNHILKFLIEDIYGKFLKVGDYPEFRKYDINLEECGLRYKPIKIKIYYNRKCFKSENTNKTILHFEVMDIFCSSADTRIVFGSDAEYHEAPWALFLKGQITSKYSGIGITLTACTGVLITFQWVLTAAHCYL